MEDKFNRSNEEMKGNKSNWMTLEGTCMLLKSVKQLFEQYQSDKTRKARKTRETR